LARDAGVGNRTVRNLERGGDVQLGTLLRILRALGRLDALDAFLPRPGVSPMELLRSGGRERQRASASRDV
jgi:transcriptional regulator with XRE-family HTH domain